MIEEFILQEEGKTLEFKESAKSLDRIIHTIIAFANTAGGIFHCLSLLPFRISLGPPLVSEVEYSPKLSFERSLL
jgi:schlafen family protein